VCPRGVGRPALLVIVARAGASAAAAASTAASAAVVDPFSVVVAVHCVGDFRSLSLKWLAGCWYVDEA